MNYEHTYILGNTLQFGSSTYVFVSELHVYVYEVNSYEGSSSKWYLLRGASVHPGMAMVES